MTGKFKQMRKVKQLLKDNTAEVLGDPNKLIEQVAGSDTVTKLNAMAKSIDDSINMLQEHIMIVQKNQLEFEKYFQYINDKIDKLEQKLK